MAQTFAKNKLSWSTNWKSIKVTATATLWTTIHTAVSWTTNYDEVWLYATNTSTTNVNLTIEYWGATSPDNLFITTIPAYSTILVTPWLLLNNWLVITAFAGTANVININWYTHNITNS